MAVSEAREDVKLLGHWVSPFVTKVAIALNLKGVRYQLLEEEIRSKGGLVKSELLLKSNPVYKKIPVLIHNGKPICESMIIVQYIDEVWASRGTSIVPSDPHERAVAQFWSVYADEVKRVICSIWKTNCFYPYYITNAFLFCSGLLNCL